MAYTSWSVAFAEQPSTAKWNILGTNDAHFYTYAADGTNAIQQVVETDYSAVATGTTITPADDTIPQITEGNEFMTQAITPKSATNRLIIEATIMLASSAATVNLIAALFQDSTANALAVASTYNETANGWVSIPLQYTMIAGTTSSTTFRIRGGASGAATVTLNGSGGNRYFGAIPKSSIKITEYKV